MGLPEDVYEAATVDGANGLQKLIYITIPLLKSTILAVLMLGFIYTLRVFDLIWIITKGGPGSATEVLPTFAYRLSFINFNFGRSAAVSVIMLLILLGGAILYLRAIMSERDYKRVHVETFLRFAIGFIATAIISCPVLMVSTSLKPNLRFFNSSCTIPSHPQVDSYRSALGLPTDRPELYITGALYFKNSFIIASSTMLLTLVLAIPAAYALSRFNFGGKTTFMLFLLVAQMLPAVLLVIPLFVLFKMFSLYNTHLSVILADTALALPFAIIILRTSFIQIPDALEEAGLIDGATRLQVLWYIVLPLIRASLVAVGSSHS
jgi:ABC-type glycerol-3-phosphate transport system permease component